MKELITKDDLIQLGYPKYTSIQIIRQAKQMMVQKGYPFYNNKRLEEWKARQAKIGIHDFVFSYDRMPMLKSTISRIIGRFAKLANVHRVQAKGLRHSHASYLINEFNVSV
ncbi:hypothetical protein J6TS1_28270 [Siminovitchia terrae]|uniref:Tyr recombinase domain-containing protein n=2 Tax=Bacillaceae TaxID=186817 RepID=A0ABQ4KZ42_SIMTE|nr:hypothetical protein J6TS1_28270 [Siminovitchia terrae]